MCWAMLVACVNQCVCAAALIGLPDRIGRHRAEVAEVGRHTQGERHGETKSSLYLLSGCKHSGLHALYGPLVHELGY